ncbi:Copia protein [Porphyridium purpureum]|uniref:Copia protein n=1 Tax=Porphyridium purpureum TaxID=35688 RepID=A0A5J4YPI2_PORPP|nr:Copia protein [Porphyridium purpureum]|eukprot:POR1283..scf296_7
MNAGVRALLLQAGLPTDWFPAAARYYALARNLTWKHDGPSGKKTAYEARFGRAWDKSVPPFGSGVIVFNDGHAKFEPSGRAAIVVGLVLTHDHHMNLEVVLLDDLRMDAAKPVLEWKILDHSLPAKSLRLRPTYEDQTEHLHFGQFATGDEEVSAEIRYCARCSRPEPGVVRCDKCRFGAAARSRHVCAWTEAEDAAIRSGKELFVPRWQTVVGSHPDVFKLNFRSGKDVRARAVNLKLVKEPREQPQLEISTIELEIDALDENPECLVTEAIPAAAAMKTPDGRAALEKEMKTLSESGTLKLENVIQREDAAALKDARFVKLKPIFGVKNSELPPEHHKTKCRVVAQGCIVADASKRRVMDSEFSFDKPAGIVAMRMAMSAAILENGREAEGVFFDIDGAYLHAPLKGPPVYGYVRELAGILKGHAAEKCKRINEPVVKIERALYGLKRSASDFSHFARDKLVSIGWLESSSDRNLYSKKEKGGWVTYLVLYVDDGAIFGRSDAAARAMEEIPGLFEISKTSQLSAASKEQPVLYLGINIYPEGNAAAWVLDMEANDTMVATKAPESRQRSTPMSRRVEAVESLHKQACSEEHRSTIGQLLWLTRTTRPDLAHAVFQIARHVDRWTSDAERALTEVLKYLVKHTSVALRYTIPIKDTDSGIHLEAHCDADFHADGSTSGYVLFFKEPTENTRHSVDWGSRRQRRTVASTAEVEIVAMHDVTQLCVFPAATFISELGEWPAVRILAGNETALKAVARGFSDKLLYVNKTQRISIKWLHELSADELVGFEYVATRAKQADALTKPTSADVFRKTLHSWGLSQERDERAIAIAYSSEAVKNYNNDHFITEDRRQHALSLWNTLSFASMRAEMGENPRAAEVIEALVTRAHAIQKQLSKEYQSDTLLRDCLARSVQGESFAA